MPGRGDFPRVIPVTLQFEGGKSNNPKDPGGRTNRGVTQRAYNGDCAARSVATKSVYLLTLDETVDFYYRNYWTQSGAAFQPWPLDLLLFDCGVNSGPPRARELLTQASLGGHLSAARYLDARLLFLQGLVARRPASAIFLPGWTRRIDQLREIACPQFHTIAAMQQAA